MQPPGPACKVSVRCTPRWQRLCCGSLPIGACTAKVPVGKAAGEAVVLASTHDLLHACLLRVRVSWGFRVEGRVGVRVADRFGVRVGDRVGVGVGV